MAFTKPIINYRRQRTYNNVASNVAGATSSALRTAETMDTDTDTLVVRQCDVYPVLDDITDGTIGNVRGGGGNTWKFEIYGNDRASSTAADNWVLLATITDDGTAGGVFSDGSELTNAGNSTWRQFKVVLTHLTGTVNVVAGDDISIDTELGVDTGSFAFYMPASSITSGSETYYLGCNVISLTEASERDTNTYFDVGLLYPGYQNTRDGSVDNPYRLIQDADDNLAGAYDKIGAYGGTYDEGLDIQNAVVLSAFDGYAPAITRGIGARATRYTSTVYNNANTLFFNEVGGGDGTYASPYTFAAAYAARTTETLVYGGVGAANGTIEIGANYTINYTVTALSYYYPTFKFTGNYKITIQTAGFLSGIIIDANNTAVTPVELTGTCNIWDCTFINGTPSGSDGIFITITASASMTATLYRNLFYDGMGAIDGTVDNCTLTATWQHNIFYNMNDYGVVALAGAGIGTDTLDGIIEDNLFYDCNTNPVLTGLTTWNCFDYTNLNAATNFEFVRNTFFSCGDGIAIEGIAPGTNDFSACVFQAIINTAVFSDVNLTITQFCFYNNGTDKEESGGATITSNLEIAEDPKFCKITAPYKLGLQPNSPLTNEYGVYEDIGANFKIMSANNSGLIVNGFYFDCQSQWNEGLLLRENNTDVKWCTFYNSQGMGLAIAEDDSGGTRINSEVLNCKFFDNGSGLSCEAQTLNVAYNLFYDLDSTALYNNMSGLTLNHNDFTLNGLALKIGVSAANPAITNNIIANNSDGIDSDIIVLNSQFMYNCHIDSIDTNVDTSDSTNVNRDPLFIDPVTEGDSKNLNIKTVEAAAQQTPVAAWQDSGCKDAGSSDIGVYQFSSRGIAEEYWQSYQFVFNPEFVNEAFNPKGLVNNDNAEGSRFLYAKSHKKVFPFVWTTNRNTDETQRKTINYMNTLAQTRHNSLTKDETIFRIDMRPGTGFASGTGTVAATAKTLTDSNAAWVPFEHELYWVGIHFKAGTSLVIDASGKTATKASEFTGEDWTGYYLEVNNISFYIKSNTDNALTLSDPDGNLTNQTLSIYAIKKYFKIDSNESQVLNLLDKDAELSDGSYSYDIFFIECRLQKSDNSFTQNRFHPTREFTKSGGSLILEST